jgi:alkylation response protein AidB-like acyl-CoA dehydrogenase
LTANCVVTRDGKPVMVDGHQMPLWRMVMLPREQAEVLDTWNVVGLCGTGSNDVLIKDVFVPNHHTLDFFNGEPCVSAPVYRSFVAQAGLILAALAIGMARGALADIVALTRTRKQRMLAATDMSGSELLQLRIGQSQAALEALTLALHNKARDYVAGASDLPIGPAQMEHPLVVSCSAMAHWIVGRAKEVVDMAYDAGGGTSVHRSSTLQRRFRDMHTLTSHVNLSESQPIKLGKGIIDGIIPPLWALPES